MDEVYKLTLPEAVELMDYWADYPPAHVLMAARYGHEPRRKKKGTAVEEAEDLGAMFGAAPQKPPDYIMGALTWAEEVKKKWN